MNNLFIIVLKERAPFIIKQFPKNEITVLEHGNDFLKIIFNTINSFTLLDLFHSGIDYGKELFSPTLSR